MTRRKNIPTPRQGDLLLRTVGHFASSAIDFSGELWELRPQTPAEIKKFFNSGTYATLRHEYNMLLQAQVAAGVRMLEAAQGVLYI
jgi:hypothetical protein